MDIRLKDVVIVGLSTVVVGSIMGSYAGAFIGSVLGVMAGKRLMGE